MQKMETNSGQWKHFYFWYPFNLGTECVFRVKLKGEPNPNYVCLFALDGSEHMLLCHDSTGPVAVPAT